MSEPNTFGPAGVQYGDWRGTISLDNSDEFDSLYELACASVRK
jgi:hypothetical protein